MHFMPSPGDLVGPYRLVKILGSGGGGQVWEAVDTRVDRHVAMKRLPPEPAPSEESVARFKQEAKYLSELNHQNIVAAHDFSLVSAPYYIVEELVSGESLRDRSEERRLEKDRRG